MARSNRRKEYEQKIKRNKQKDPARQELKKALLARQEEPEDPNRQEIKKALLARRKELLARRAEANSPDLIPLDNLLIPFDEFKETALSYIKQTGPPIQQFNKEYYQFLRADEIKKLYARKFNYIQKVTKSYNIKKGFKWSAWNDPERDLQPEKGEQRKKVSKLFRPIYSLLWSKTISYQDTIDLTERYKLPMCKDLYQVIVIPNIEKIAEQEETTPDNIRKIIQRWTANNGPVKRIGMTTRKRDQGKTIYSLGLWLNDGGRRNSFFIKKDYEAWLRQIYFC